MENFWWGLLILALIVSFTLNKKHFLMALLLLESLMVILLFVFYSSVFGSGLHLYLVFITLSACEGALGLSILVSLVRSYSSDYLLMLASTLYDGV